MIQVKPIKTDCSKGPLTLLELLGWLDISQTLLGPLQGDSLPENEVNSEQSRAKNDSWGERQRLMLDLVKSKPLLFLDFPLVFWPDLVAGGNLSSQTRGQTRAPCIGNSE